MTGRSIKFDQAPAVGLRLSFDGQTFQLTAVDPYRRKDGALSNLLTWETACADCGAAFPMITGLVGKLDYRRCPDHRQPLKRVAKC